LSDTIVWLGYLIGAAIAFWVVHSHSWKVTLATIVGGLAGLAIWAVTFLATSSEERSSWLQVEVALNGSLSLIFAAAGAAAALALKHRRHE
jgi:hypothetical protein